MFALREISVSDHTTLKEAAELITRYSWGEAYPVCPLTELTRGEYHIGAYAEGQLTGFASLNRWASPDKMDNGALWLADIVIIPDLRQRGISKVLYENIKNRFENHTNDKVLYSCTDNPIMRNFFLAREWEYFRKTLDESGGDCDVYAYRK